MNNFQIVPYEFKGSPVRTITEDGETWFVANDVCDALGYGNSREALSKHVDNDDVTKRDAVPDSLGRKNTANLINESGLYALIFGSTLPAAREFKHWVTSELLPQIRKTGQFQSDLSLALGEPQRKKLLGIIAKQADQNLVLKQENYSLQLKLILKTAKRFNEKDIERMMEIKSKIEGGLFAMTEEELARAFRMSPDRYKLIVFLWNESKPEKVLATRNAVKAKFAELNERAGNEHNM